MYTKVSKEINSQLRKLAKDISIGDLEKIDPQEIIYDDFLVIQKKSIKNPHFNKKKLLEVDAHEILSKM
ncbi:MAG: hypothetical protein ACTSR8_09250 [Promethearchaeota archaeon]